MSAPDVPLPMGYPNSRDAPPAPRTHHDVLHGWDVPLDQVDVERMRARERLAAEARRLVEAVALLDFSQVEAPEIDALVAAVREDADRVASLPSLLTYGGAALGPVGASALDQRSPVSGQANPIAPPMTVDFDGERATGWAVYGPAYEGPPMHVHGGWVIAAFDELLGVAQVAGGGPGMTGTLTIRLRRPTPIGVRVEYEGWVDRVEGRKTFCKGEARIEGEVVAEAEGIFIAPKNWVEAIEGGAA
ncbi:MAG: PaaI family thioesterase [Actinobacteria bacterium]|nr:PaaI family thioesterase [Actinomycetota bacterium]